MEQLEFALKDDGQEISIWYMRNEYYVQLRGDYFIERHGLNLRTVITEVVAAHAELVRVDSESNAE